MERRARSVTPDMVMERNEKIALDVLMGFASGIRHNVDDQKVADPKVADAADEKAADWNAADWNAADRKVADRKVADRKVADRKVADRKVADWNAADRNAADWRDAKRAKIYDERPAEEGMKREIEPLYSEKFTAQLRILEEGVIDVTDIEHAIDCRKIQDSRCQTSANMNGMYGWIVGLHQDAVKNNTAVLERPYTGKGGTPPIMKSDRPTLSVGVFAGNRMFSVADTMLKKYAAFKYLLTKLPVQHVYRVQLDAKDEPKFNTLGCPFLDGLQFFVMTDKQLLAFFSAYCQLTNSRGIKKELQGESDTLKILGNFWRKSIDKLGFVYQKFVTPSKLYVHTFMWCQGMYNMKAQQGVGNDGGQNKHMSIIKDVSVALTYEKDLWPTWYVNPMHIQMCFGISMSLPIMACHYNEAGYVEGRYIKLCKESSKIELMRKEGGS